MSKAIKKTAKKSATKTVAEKPQETKKAKPAPTSLYEILGEKEESLYSHDNIEAYSAFLRSMSMYDIQRHSVTVNIKPVSDRSALIKILESNFINYMQERSKYIKNTKPKDLYSLLADFDEDDKLKRKSTQKTLFDF